MRTTYITVLLMLKTSVNKVSALAHKLYLSSHAHDFYKQRFCSSAQLVLQFFWWSRRLLTTVLLMRTTYTTVLMRKNSIDKGSAHAHNSYYSSAHAQDFHEQRFCSCAQLILQFSRARRLLTTVLLKRTTYIRVLPMRKTSINNGFAHSRNLYYSYHAQDFHKHRFCSCAQVILQFPCARRL